MYGYLLRIASPPIAQGLCAIWYAALIVAIIACSFEPAADFRYGRY